ncbi:MAG: PmoA family protein [Planctomycetes bacterium]|nr:PmoA family protein [Planctomycetota bacterium]
MLIRHTGVLACVLFFFGLATNLAADQFDLADSKGEHLDILTPAGAPILRYMYQRDTSTPEKKFNTAKVFAHVMAPDGKTTLTKGSGGLYSHHRGIFIGWNKLKHDGKSHDLWHVRNTAQLHEKFLQTKADKSSATITSLIRWIGVSGEPVIEEERTYRVVGRDDAYAEIDFTSKLTAVNGDVTLDGDPEHAGVQFRPSQQVAENKSAEYTFHEKGVDPKKQQDLPWVAVTFRVDDQAWTVQHMSHPKNAMGARWSAYRNYGRFGPFTVVEIPDGKTHTFRYRFRVTMGDPLSTEEFARHYERYAKE